MTSCTDGGFIAKNNSHSLLCHFGSRFGTAAYVCLHLLVFNTHALALDSFIKLFLAILSDVDFDGRFSLHCTGRCAVKLMSRC